MISDTCDRNCPTPLRKVEDMKTEQLEILLAQPPFRRPFARVRRTSRARWWFTQMRRVVDEAIESSPAGRPEQSCLPLSRR
jgi:hypothetical protein